MLSAFLAIMLSNFENSPADKEKTHKLKWYVALWYTVRCWTLVEDADLPVEESADMQVLVK